MAMPSTSAPRRSVSLPPPRLASSSPDPQIEILFTLPSARVISFSSKPSSRPGSSSGATNTEEEPGTLSWASPFERTIAVGPLRIYRAPGSVAFLSCVNALRPILPKSQAWFVDGTGAKFVLQIRPPQYWRIEIPTTTAEELRMLAELTRILEQVLLLDKTPCPFERDFVVELPAKPETPVKKRPWRPVERPQSDDSPKSSPLVQAIAIEDESRPSTPCPAPNLSVSMERRPASPPTPLQNRRLSSKNSECGILPAVEDVDISKITSSNRASDNKPQKLPSGPALSEENLSLLRTSESEFVFGGYVAEGEESDSCSEATNNKILTLRSSTDAHPPLADTEIENNRLQSMPNSSRSVTAPPLLSLITCPIPKTRTQSPLRTATSFESASSECSSSVESFHSTQSWAPPSPPTSEPGSPSTYPFLHENIILPKRSLYTREASELTVTREKSRVWDMTASSARSKARSLSPPPKTPPNLVHDGSDKSDEEKYEITTPPTVRSSVRHRATTSSNSRRRELSPLPAAVNLFSPPRRRQRHLRTSRHLPTAIIQKTCEILMSPPSHLFHLMISIASKIAAGEWRGVLSGHGEAVHWDFEDEYGSNTLYEDDYGNPISKTAPPKAKTSGAIVPVGTCEID
ncbi:uncharacterized protein L3040_003647 [Drepanopeziza brunnea f. sp. 'multigermtubi']|uniref:Inheritance of peroxisomes protein 1 n=1 Tax=Marssonina brunnea f. sp. multigermtubi (strain MB_m1) TaxID=1072389 RepID=K1X014_MARBU|nr:uncharacterized protein MBM_07443 [Drepanopeziza brunnea f. sp. 'multigermtubi' MB_m1]EKD14213.1 hypothetical protein MBM_07443 [Drepanopeziza brunnea f. sp. 'multigermtubi' MB_m1]KAJ5046403.1 hypothetical protein L3040_003647 [Drepanopeziza brunnea f. sp. 'multigermtubi']